MPIAGGLIGGGNCFVLQHTPGWTEARRVSQPLLNGAALNAYEKLQELESVHLLAAYLYRPHQWHSHHYRYCISVIHRLILGEGLFKSSPELDDLQRVTTEFLQSINASVIDFFPKLAKLPKFFQPWRSQYITMSLSHRQVFEKRWAPVKEAIARDTAPPSFVRDMLLHDATKYTGTDVDAIYIAMSTISAGSDNPRMAMNAFVMAALCHLDSMQTARDEIDKMCGGHAERLPCFGDMTELPYVYALAKEVLRWRPTVPLIPQHQLTENIEFEGYRFPAGTEFVINGIAVGEDYEHPEVFDPQRWLNGNEANVTHGLWHFGGGRRICIGYRLGQKELFRAFARLLYCLDYAAVNLTFRWTPGLQRILIFGRLALAIIGGCAIMSEMSLFPVRVTVRSEEHRQLIIGEATHTGVLESARIEF